MFKCVPFILSLSIFLIGQQIPDGEPLLLKPPREEVSRGLSYYENILRKNPDLPEAHFGAGHSAYSIENYERAQQEFKASSQSERKDLQSKITLQPRQHTPPARSPRRKSYGLSEGYTA